jgi:hypothetical protein
MPKKPSKRDPIIVYKREERGLKPFLPKSGAFRFGPPALPSGQQAKTKKPKEVKQVVPEKVQFHNACIAEIEAMPIPDREIARACYYLCYLVHETKTSNELFPLKHNALEKIFKSAHPCLTVNYVRRGDREIYQLSPEAKKKWESETGGNKHHTRMYLTSKCKIEYEESWFDLYHFHIVIEPFRFSFYLPIHQAQWMNKKRLTKRPFHYPQTVEYGLVRGKIITTSRKTTMLPLETIKAELQKLADLEIQKKK